MLSGRFILTPCTSSPHEIDLIISSIKRSRFMSLLAMQEIWIRLAKFVLLFQNLIESDQI